MASKATERQTYIFVAIRPAVLNIPLGGGMLFFRTGQAIRTNDSTLAREMNGNKNFELAQGTYTVISSIIT